MIDKIGLALLTMFGIGHFKYAPGTIASFVTCLIYYSIPFVYGLNKLYLLVFLVLILIYSIILIDKLIHKFKKKDPNEIVIDEFIGQSIPLVAIYFIPQSFFLEYLNPNGRDLWYLSSFITFRLFDIFKPWPISIVDKKIKNGIGVMLDDIIAGVFSTIATIFIYILLS
jgi:phosphatidylglycerophosphatase A